MGGNINSLLVDLSGIEIGPAFLAAIGVPDKEAIRCMVADCSTPNASTLSQSPFMPKHNFALNRSL